MTLNRILLWIFSCEVLLYTIGISFPVWKWFYLESLTFFTQFCFFSISSYCELNIANHEQSFKWLGLSLREKCPNPEFFLARIFLYSDWIQENTDQEKLHIWTLSTQWLIFLKHSIISSFTTKFQTSLIISALSVMGEECSFTINKRLILTLRKIDLTV